MKRSVIGILLLTFFLVFTVSCKTNGNEITKINDIGSETPLYEVKFKDGSVLYYDSDVKRRGSDIDYDVAPKQRALTKKEYEELFPGLELSEETAGYFDPETGELIRTYAIVGLVPFRSTTYVYTGRKYVDVLEEISGGKTSEIDGITINACCVKAKGSEPSYNVSAVFYMEDWYTYVNTLLQGEAEEALKKNAETVMSLIRNKNAWLKTKIKY